MIQQLPYRDVSVRLPVTHSDFKYKLYSAVSIHFSYKNDLCSLQLPSFELLTINKNQIELIDRHSNFKCIGDLCQYIEHVRSNLHGNPCLASLTSTTSQQDFHRSCPLTCHFRKERDLPLITKVDQFHYSIINLPPAANLLTYKNDDFVSSNLLKSTPLNVTSSTHGP